MGACSKGHAWVENNDDLIVGRRNILMPRRGDNNIVTRAKWSVMLFPSVSPVLFLAFTNLELTDLPHSTQVPERLANVV